MGAWIGFIWLRIGTGVGCCEWRIEPWEFQKIRGIYLLAVKLLDSEKGLCYMDLVRTAL